MSPPQEVIAPCWRRSSRGSGRAGDLEFVLHHVSRQPSMVDLDVELEVFKEIVLAGGSWARRRIRVVLVARGFLWAWAQSRRVPESDLLLYATAMWNRAR